MTHGLRFGLLLASICVLITIIYFIVKDKLNIKYSIVWILWALFALLMSIFPETFYGLADLLSIEMPVNAVFLIMIFLLYVLTFYVFLMISKHNEEIIQLTYETARLKKEIEECMKNMNVGAKNGKKGK